MSALDTALEVARHAGPTGIAGMAIVAVRQMVLSYLHQPPETIRARFEGKVALRRLKIELETKGRRRGKR